MTFGQQGARRLPAVKSDVVVRMSQAARALLLAELETTGVRPFPQDTHQRAEEGE